MYVFPLITCSIMLSLLAVLVPTCKKSKLFRAFFVLAFCTLWWHGSWIALFLEKERDRAEIIAVLGYVGILYLPVAFHTLYAELLGTPKQTKSLHGIYCILLILLLSTRQIIDGVYEFSWGFYPKAGLLHPLFMALVSYVLINSFVKSISIVRNKQDLAKSKATKIGILACLIFSLGSYDFLMNYRITESHPVGFISSILFVIVIAFGIVGYDLFQKDARIMSLNQENEREKIRTQEKERYIEQISRQNQELRLRDEIISSFVSPAIRGEIALGENPLCYQPQKFYRSVVFFDMRDFTKLAEQSDLDQIFSLINSYFELVNRAVYAHMGEVNKYLGDGVLALFASPSHCLIAISQFIRDLETFNQSQLARGAAEIKLGIGISFGEVLCGNFGSDTKLERSVIGDVVNIAARLEKITKEYSCQVVCDETFMLQIANWEFHRPIAIEVLKGKSIPTTIHEILFPRQGEDSSYWLSTRPILSLALNFCREGFYGKALETLHEIVNKGGRADLPLEAIVQSITSKIELKNERRSA